MQNDHKPLAWRGWRHTREHSARDHFTQALGNALFPHDVIMHNLVERLKLLVRAGRKYSLLGPGLLARGTLRRLRDGLWRTGLGRSSLRRRAQDRSGFFLRHHSVLFPAAYGTQE